MKVKTPIIEQLERQLESARGRLAEENEELEARELYLVETTSKIQKRIDVQKDTISYVENEIVALESAIGILYESQPDLPTAEPADPPPTPTEDYKPQ